MNKLGFGFLRLPQNEDKSIAMDKVCPMVDAYLAEGKTYFDTAYAYLNGMSEVALGEALVKRYPRSSFQIAAKMPGYKVECYEDCQGFFNEEAVRCGTDYFDVYMLHWLNEKHYRIAEKTGQFNFLQELKEKGKAKKIGFSYHDTAELLDEILTAHPEVDCVLMQLNYVDWESPSIQARLCYETAVRHGKAVYVMEPIKGGTLVNLPDEAMKLFRGHFPHDTPASVALRFAESLPGVEIVLSGMGTVEQIQENLQERQPLTAEEQAALMEIARLINKATAIPCTACAYCLKGCPQNMPIPDYFKLYNDISRTPKDGWKITPVYDKLKSKGSAPSDCLSCGECEKACPQKLPIVELLQKVSSTFEPA